MTDPERDCPRSLCESARFMPFASGTNKPPQGTFNQIRPTSRGGFHGPKWDEVSLTCGKNGWRRIDQSSRLVLNDKKSWLVSGANESWTTQQISSSIDGCKMILRGPKHYLKQRSGCFKEKPTKFHSNFLKLSRNPTGRHFLERPFSEMVGLMMESPRGLIHIYSTNPPPNIPRQK